MINSDVDLDQVDVDDHNPYDDYEDDDYVKCKPNKMKSPKFREYKSQ